MTSPDRPDTAPTDRETREPAPNSPTPSSAMPSSPASLRLRLRDKLPELILEAASVVFAVLLALAVDQWRDTRAEQRHAERAQAAIVHELRSNASEVEEMLGRNRLGVERLRAAIAAAESGDQLELNYQLAELSSAAWESARLTGAASELELDWLIEVARIYELQELYADGQRQIVERIATLGEAIAEGEATAVLRGLAGRAEGLLELSSALLGRYREFLEEGEGVEETAEAPP